MNVNDALLLLTHTDNSCTCFIIRGTLVAKTTPQNNKWLLIIVTTKMSMKHIYLAYTATMQS